MPSGFWRSGNFSIGGFLVQEKIKTGITAYAGGGQTSATALTGAVNVVATVASAGDSVLLPIVPLGAEVTVKNTSANSMDVFPQSGGNIDAASANAAEAVAGGAGAIFKCVAINATTGAASWIAL